ncbi:helix-turn-helix domain-containing protein [Phenylobacterium sp. VNQ135]|uniref:AraC family transcriptional regulator n=1 Tax=Phenylobacterium sp. VNQ135 TaxID=3400922 RepID=UPI003C0C24F9
MTDWPLLLDMFIRGVAVGGVLALALAVQRSELSRAVRLVSLAFGISAAAWIITESDALWAATGHARWLMTLACPVAGFFWLFAAAVFRDRPVTPLALVPVGLLWISGFLMGPDPAAAPDWLWGARNLFSGLLSLHILWMIVEGWSGDLLEARRRLRGPVLGLAATFSVVMVVLAISNRIQPNAAVRYVDVGELYGGLVVAVLALASAIVFLQARGEVFGAPRRPVAVDARAEAADRTLLRELDAFMASEGWRTEGLTIGALAQAVGAPEHRLRRLINQRLGHRNFAEFLNAHRIEAAKRRLADPAQARATVAAIAYDLGYGSLGPFNRAFRAATGVTPTEWRRQALASPELQEAV